MFPLKNRQLIRGCRAHINAGLSCAGDYVADQDNLYSPFSGSLRSFYGHQGGNWLELTRDNGERIRFAHLERYVKKTGRVAEGELIAITGNTGFLSTGPHLHLEVYDKFGKRLDPESYTWHNEDMSCETEKEEIRKLNTEIATVTKARDEYRDLYEKEVADHKESIKQKTEHYDNWQLEIDARKRAEADLKTCRDSGLLTPEQQRVLNLFDELKSLL